MQRATHVTCYDIVTLYLYLTNVQIYEIGNIFNELNYYKKKVFKSVQLDSEITYHYILPLFVTIIIT